MGCKKIRYRTLAILLLAFVVLCGASWMVVSAGGPNANNDPIAVYQGTLVFTSRGRMWKADEASCWEFVTEFGSVRTDTRALLDLGDRLLIGTYRSGLWVLKDGSLEPETHDFLSITELNRDIFSLARWSDQIVLVGASGTSGLPRSGLWTWNVPLRAQGWSSADEFGFPSNVSVFSIAVDRETPDGEAVAYAGTDRAGIYKGTITSGWTRMAESYTEAGTRLLRGVQVQALAVGGQASNRIVYAGGGSTEVRNKGFYRFRASNPEAVWEEAGGTVIGADIAVWAITADPQRSQGVWAGTELGLFYSANAGNDWISIAAFHGETIRGLLVEEERVYARTSSAMHFASLDQARQREGQWTKAVILDEGKRCLELTPTSTSTAKPTTTATSTRKPTRTATWIPTATSTPTATATPEDNSIVEWLKQTGEFIDDVAPLVGVLLVIALAFVLAIRLRRRGMHWREVAREMGRFFWKLLPEQVKKAIEEVDQGKRQNGKGE